MCSKWKDTTNAKDNKRGKFNKTMKKIEIQESK